MRPALSVVRLAAATLASIGLVLAVSQSGAPIFVATCLAVGIAGALMMMPRWRRTALALPACLLAAAIAAQLDVAALPWVVATVAAIGAAPNTPSPSLGQRVSSAAVATVIAVGAMACASVFVELGSESLVAAVATSLCIVAIGVGQAVSHLDTSHNRVSYWRVHQALSVRRRPAVFRALQRAEQGWMCTRDVDVRSGLDEVSNWVFTLQVHQQAIDRDVAVLACATTQSTETPDGRDAFAAKQRAAASSLRARQEDHVRTLRVEAERTSALVEFALAWLDDAVASLTVAQRTAQVAAPIDMDRILARLRAHEREQDALRRTLVELA